MMTRQEMAEAQRTGFALARAMSTGDTSSVADVVAGMSPAEMRRALIGTAAMTAYVVQRAGLDWDALHAEMERRLTA